jgi:hypothetical protein
VLAAPLDHRAMIRSMRVIPRALAALLLLAARPVIASAQERTPQPQANACLVWITNSLLANPYFQVAKNTCDYAIEIAYRYEEDVGTGCFGPSSSCDGILMPSEIRRFTAGTIRFWACRLPAVPKFPDIAKDGSCE